MYLRRTGFALTACRQTMPPSNFSIKDKVIVRNASMDVWESLRTPTLINGVYGTFIFPTQDTLSKKSLTS